MKLRLLAIPLAVSLIVLAVVAIGDEPLTRDNWGASVGFAPDLNIEGFTPGTTVIDSSNVAQFEALLPDAVLKMVKKYGMKMETTPYQHYAPSDGYIAASNRYRGTARLIDIGDDTEKREIEDYEGGLPFVQPKDGREISWNYTLAYGGDDGENEFEVYWIDAKRGVERVEQWKTTHIRSRFRTDIEPLPETPFLVKKGVIFATLTTALKPFDKRGFSSLYYGYFEPKEPNGWLYIPSQRRAMQLTFGTRGETWNNTDLLYEDVRGYTGSPEWMRWRLVKKATMLAPMHAGVITEAGGAKKAFDMDAPPHWNPRVKWEPRPMYIVEAVPKLRGYPYSKMVFAIDAESSHIFTKTAYDRRGKLWKLLINAANGSPDPAKLPPQVALSLVVDVQSEHATAFYWLKQKNNIGVDARLFTLSTLRKMGR